VNYSLRNERLLARETIDGIGLRPPDFGGAEREEINKRVQSFRAHQQRLIREREEYAASILQKMLSNIR
jgi:hypothetical protein